MRLTTAPKRRLLTPLAVADKQLQNDNVDDGNDD